MPKSNFEELVKDNPIAVAALNVIEDISRLETEMMNKLPILEGNKAELKRIEAQHMGSISADKVRYTNEKSREAAVIEKCAVDPLYQQTLEEVTECNIKFSEIKIELTKLNNILNVLNAYMNSKGV